MAYFKSFPKINYSFNGESAVATNLSAYAEVIDEVRLATSFYQDYYISNDERADHVAFKLYNDPQLHWVLYLMNPKLREQGWPMGNSDLISYVKKEHPNTTLVIRADMTTRLRVGTVIRGYTSEAVGTIIYKDLNLGQLTVRTDGTFEAGELIEDVESGVVYNDFTVALVVKEHLSAHHYTLNGEHVDINPYEPVPADVIKTTFLEVYQAENDELKQIRIVKPNSINTVVSAFRKAIQS